MTKLINISIVDDDPDLSEKIADYLGKSERYRCVSSYTSAEEALTGLPRDKPDVVLMDINLGGMSGIDCLRQLKPRLPRTPFLMLTVFEDTNKILKAITAGASGYLLKRMPPGKLLDAIEEVIEGGSPMSGPVARRVLQLLKRLPLSDDDSTSLSEREREVLNGLAAGQLYKQIADEMGISRHTVRSYIRRVYEKLHVSSRTEAVAKYLGY
jgi:DNA-binding NarL/FixJ family response regulator